MKPRQDVCAPDEADTDAFVVLSESETVLEANARACEILERGHEELLGAGQYDVLDPSDPRLGSALEQLERTGRFAGLLNLLKGDGRSFPAGTEMTAVPREDAPDTVHISFRTARTGDVDREVLFRLIVQNASDIVSIYDFPDARLRYISPAVERVLGYTPEEAVARGGIGGAPEVVHPEDVPKMMAGFAEVLTNPGVGPPVRLRVRHKDGSWRHIEGFCNNLLHEPEVGGVVAVWRDITERVEAEEEVQRLNAELEERVRRRTAQLEATLTELEDSEELLRKGLEMFRTTFERAAVGIAHVDPEGRILRANDRLCEISGHAREELLRKAFREITHPADAEADAEERERLLSGEVETYSMDERLVRADGSLVWVSLSVSLVREPSGEPSYLIAVAEDVDERKRAELALRSLTGREREVLDLLAQRATNAGIARELYISERTAKFHVQNIIEKLGVADRRQAAERATSFGLVGEGSP